MSKSEVELQVPEKTVVQKAHTKTVTRFTCDICSKQIDKSQDNRYGSGMSKCSICGRDICRTRKSNYLPTCYVSDPDEMGDYPDKICIICEPIYIPARREMNERHWNEEEQLEKSIKAQSLKTKVSNLK